MSLLARFKSVRFTLTLWYSLILLAAFTLFGTSTYFYLARLLEGELEKNLVDEVNWINEIIEIDRVRLHGKRNLEALSDDVENRIVEHYSATPRNYIVLLASTAGQMLYESDERVERILPPQRFSARSPTLQTVYDEEGTKFRIASRMAEPFVIHVAYTEQTIQRVLNNLLSIFGTLAPIVLFVAVSAGWVIAGLILRPIDNITAMADRISATSLSERIPERKTRDELGRLIGTMNNMISRLEASFNEMKQFSMNVAHELKTPLTILKGESELALTKQMSPDDLQGLITTYLEETVRMSRTVDDLLTLAKADAGQLTIRHEPVDLRHLIDELYEDALLLASHKRLDIRLEKTQPATVSGDEIRLRQLFRILLTNAIQYTNAGGTIALACAAHDGTVTVTIKDTGIGIPAENLGRIFDRFFRDERARARASGGSGLGLSIARWIVESHHGEILVESHAGRGSTFSVRLPLDI